jgi:hypothetical membrane protein
VKNSRVARYLPCRQIGFFGIGAWILFWAASVVLASFRPSYSFVANTISELGAVGTSHATVWNLFGFIIPGIVLGIVGAVIALTANPQSSVSRALTTALLLLAGFAVAGQGFMPAEMVDGVADITSASTRGHFISSIISGLAWAAGALLLVGPMKRNPRWQGLHIVSFGLVLVTLLASFALRGRLQDGLAERIGDAFFCAWFVVMSVRLIGLKPARSSSAPVLPGS